MRFSLPLRTTAIGLIAAFILCAQNPPLIVQPRQDPEPPRPQNQQQQPAPQTANPNAPPNRLATSQGFMLPGNSLTEMIDILAKMMKIKYILDPRVKGSVTLYTYGEVKDVELMPLLQTILRVNGAAIVPVGDLYHIVPINTISMLPLSPVMNADPKTLPDDERMVLNLIFLKYTMATEMDKLLKPFYGEGAGSSVYEPGNLLILQDNARSMKRTMEMLALFDSEQFAGQRVRLFEIENSRPSDLVKELETVFKAYALSEKSSAVKFIPVDRINTLIVVTTNPGVFADVEKWIQKLDIPVKITAGSTNNYVYRLKYGRAETVAMAIMALYSGDPMAMVMLAGMMNQGNNGGGMMGGGMGYGGMGAMGMMGMGMMGGGYGGYGGYGGMGYGGMGYGGYNPYGMTGVSQPPINTAFGASATPQPANAAPGDLTGSYLGMAGGGGRQVYKGPHVIPNPFDNTLLIQGSAQEWEQINSLLRQLDVPPRQVLVDAKIYELQLTGAFSAGVSAYLQKVGSGTQGTTSRILNAASGAGGMTLSAGALVLRSHELLAALATAESNHQSRVISAPSIIATDSIPATMNVGQDVPVLTSQAVAGGVQSGGSNVFTNTISNRSTGVTLKILARVNSSGVVTMEIDQDVSDPQGNTSSGINSPSFSRRSFSTQVTVQDGDTIAVGGFIGESNVKDSSGVPLLNRIPLLGAAFGSKSYSKARTELVIFLTPRVIYDTNQIQDASDEVKSNLKKLQKTINRQGQ